MKESKLQSTKEAEDFIAKFSGRIVVNKLKKESIDINIVKSILSIAKKESGIGVDCFKFNNNCWLTDHSVNEIISTVNKATEGTVSCSYNYDDGTFLCQILD